MTKTFILLIAHFLWKDCVSGLEIRLTDQLGISSVTGPGGGYIEVFNNGYWSPICSDNWEDTGAQVLCRMLGYSTSSTYIYGSWTTRMYNISCTGTESSLKECMDSISYRYYPYADLAYVRCGSGHTTSMDTQSTGLGLRLVGAANPYEGRVEIFALNQWMSIYAPNNTWSDKEAAVVCRTLGLSTDGSKGFKINLLNNLKCTGVEKSLDQCIYNTVDCTQGNIIYLQCGCYASGCSGNGNYCDIMRNSCVTACPPGSYVSGSRCYLCAVGYYQPLQHQWYYCNECPAGTYQNRTGQTVCTACPSGSYQAKLGQASCDICPPGTYQNQIGQSSCNPCPAGTYQYWSGQTSCLACDMGTYQNSSGELVCLLCGKDMITNRAGSNSYSECHDEFLAEQGDSISQPQMSLVIMGGYLMIGISIVNIIVCIVVMKRTCQKSGTPTTRISKPSSQVRRRNTYVSENPSEEQYEECERH
ncbi:hypothetical protein CHS0354_021356 [Potamilus streckersoni]|uniref:SRCR domain-containing protein n=1 Tax=Potamilus streckersoni TaxID=2493646 RepID=A0AAE0VP03_9BIVA|nr:hypothetical protein CHS0354_021356 [Potamilus streckersoni]